MGCFRSDAGAFFFFILPCPMKPKISGILFYFCTGKTEKQEKFCRIFVITKVQKYIIRVYF